MRPNRYPKPTWDVPAPVGHPAAIESAAGVAAPLLAGFALTFAGLVLTSGEDFRYVDLSALLLVIATVLLIYAIQFGFFARQNAVTPSEYEEWWPDLDVWERRREVLDAQRRARAEYRKWVSRFRLAYHLGILAFLAGVAAALVPPAGSSIGVLRAAAAAVVAAAALIEVAWIGSEELRRRKKTAWLRPVSQGRSTRKQATRKEKRRKMDALSNRAKGVASIKPPALNITLGSLGVISLAGALTAWKKSFEFIFGDSGTVPYGVREGVLIATIAAAVVLAAADMFARAIAARHDATHVVPWAKGWTATWTHPDPDQGGFIVAGMRVQTSNPDAVEYLLVKEGETPAWRPAEDVVLAPPS